MKMCFLQFGVLAKIQQQKQKKLIGISIAFFFWRRYYLYRWISVLQYSQ